MEQVRGVGSERFTEGSKQEVGKVRVDGGDDGNLDNGPHSPTYVDGTERAGLRGLFSPRKGTLVL